MEKSKETVSFPESPCIDDMVEVLADFSDGFHDEFSAVCGALAGIYAVSRYASDKFRSAVEEEIRDSYAAIREGYRKVVEHRPIMQKVVRWDYQ